MKNTTIVQLCAGLAVHRSGLSWKRAGEGRLARFSGLTSNTTRYGQLLLMGPQTCEEPEKREVMEGEG